GEARQYSSGAGCTLEGKLLRRLPRHYAAWLLHLGNWIHAGTQAANYPRRAAWLRKAGRRARGRVGQGARGTWRRQIRMMLSLSARESPGAGRRRSSRKKG